MKEIEVYLHGVGDKVELIRVNEDYSVADILKAAKNAGLLSDHPESVMDVFVGECKEPAHKEHKLHHLGVKERTHLICHHCKKIEVSVSYNGAVKSEHFSPTVKVGAVLKWALRAFGLSGNDAVQMVLRIDGTQNDLPNDLRIGSLVRYPHCSLKLYLTPRAGGGVMLPDESIFRDHIKMAHFLIGVDDGIWGFQGAPDAIVWPHVFIWCKATPKGEGWNKYYFRFTLDGYPTTAPMATPWNIENSQVLEREKWPKWSDYLERVFKWDWRNGQALYAPCDRSIVMDTGHQNWKEQHQAYWWTPEFTVVEYLRFLVGILNNSEEW